MHRRLSSVFGLAPVQSNGLRSEDERVTVSEWSPLVDVIEDEKEYLITAELPGVPKDEVKVTVESGVLNITGERRFEKDDKGSRHHRVERFYGNFLRSFTLPDDADAKKVNAEFKDGVLKVHIAKSEAARPKQIEVKVS
jgi:HSP20 family protein